MLLLWPLAAAAQGQPQGQPGGTPPAPAALVPISPTGGGATEPSPPSSPPVVYPGTAPIVATPLPALPDPSTTPGAAGPAAPGTTGAGTPAAAGAAATSPASPAPSASPAPGQAGSAPASAAPTGAGAPSAGTTPAGMTPAGPAGGGQPGSGATGTAPGGQTPANAPAAPADQGTPLPATWVPRGTAVLQILNKETAIAQTLSVAVAHSDKIGPLTITLQACVVRPPDMPADAAAFLRIADGRPNTPDFSGWILKNEPFLSMFQDPIYDIRVMGCRT